MHVKRRAYLVPRGTYARQTQPTLISLRAQVRINLQGVVNIESPVNTAFAPLMKHIACSFSLSPCLPAESRMIVVGRTILAVAIVRRST